MAEQYDLASGFQTLIRSSDAIASEIRSLRSTITASMDMAQRFGGQSAGPRGAAPTAPINTGQANPTAGQTTSTGGGQTTFEGVRQAAMGLVMNQVNQAVRGAQPSSGPFAPGGRYGGGSGGWTPPGPSTAGPGASGAPSSGGGAPGGGAGGAGGGGVGGGAVPPASGGPAGGSAGSWIVRNVPGVGMIANGMAELRSQQDKNNYYRNIEGGTHGNAIGERFREEGYVLGSSMVFGSEEARQAYKGVTRIGYTNRSDQRAGTTRAQALNYVYEGKKSRGQSVEEGLSQLETASKSLSVSLDSLNDSMERVSDAAGKAGVNTEMARHQMQRYMNIGIAQGQGAGASGFAEAIATTNVSYGRDFAARADSSGMYSRSMQYRAASMSGMTQGQLANMTRNDPTGAMGVYQKVIDQSTASAGVTPEMRAWIKQRVDQAGGAQGLKNQPLLAEQIANDFLNTFGGSFDQNAFADVMGQLAGTNFGGDYVLAAKFLVEQIAGNTMAAEAKQKQMQVGLTDMKGRMADGSKNAAVSSSLDKFKDLTQIGHGMFARHSKAVDAYTSTAQKSGKRDPVIEALLQSSDIAGTDAMGNSKADQTHVQVQTRSGGRVMSLADAIKEFPNEVAAGKVTFMDGAAKGKSTAALTGGKIDTTRDWRSEVQKSTKTGATLDDWNGKGTPTTPTGGVFTLGLSPDAQRLVKVMDQSGNNGAAASAGTPPTIDNNGSPVFR